MFNTILKLYLIRICNCAVTISFKFTFSNSGIWQALVVYPIS